MSGPVGPGNGDLVTWEAGVTGVLHLRNPSLCRIVEVYRNCGVQLRSFQRASKRGGGIMAALMKRQLAKSPEELGEKTRVLPVVKVPRDYGTSAIPANETCMLTTDCNGECECAVLPRELCACVRHNASLRLHSLFAFDVVQGHVRVVVPGDKCVHRL